MNDEISLLRVGSELPQWSTLPWGRWTDIAVPSLDDAAAALRARPFDALLVSTGTQLPVSSLRDWQGLSQAVLDAAVVVVVPPPDLAFAAALVEQGVQDVLSADLADVSEQARAVRLAVARKRLERDLRKAYATDLATGLPNHAQLLEHMTHLLALREREPAPMALVVLRLEGLAPAAADLGPEAANLLRRKAAVRLRAGLRASDVVASLGNDAFAVLLAWIDAPQDAQRVAEKMRHSLRQPFSVAGQTRLLGVAIGVGRYPDDGRSADVLLRRAMGDAATAAPGRGAGAGGHGATPAANDE